MYKGDYPPVMREWVDKKCEKEGRPWSTLPTFTDDEIELIKGTKFKIILFIYLPTKIWNCYAHLNEKHYFHTGSTDFHALNYYSSRWVTHGSDPNLNYNPDAEYATSVQESFFRSPFAPWLVVRLSKSNLCFSKV